MAFIKNIFTFHKKKIMLFFLACAFFIFTLFPYSDLSDLVSSLVSEKTNNTVYIQFDDLAFTLLPQPALKMSNVILESPMTPQITAQSLSAAPSLWGALQGLPLSRIYIEDLYKGNFDVSLGSSSKIKEKGAISADVEYENFDIKTFFKALQNSFPLPFTASGTGEFQAEMDVDPNMVAQPDGIFSAKIKNTQIPAFSVNLGNFGSLPVPGLTLEQLLLKGEIKNGKLLLKETQLGSNKDDLFGKISGEISLKLMPGMQNTQFGFYSLNVDLSIKEALQGQLGTYLGLLDGFVGKYKRKTLDGTRYVFKVEGRNFQDPNPRFSQSQ